MPTTASTTAQRACLAAALALGAIVAAANLSVLFHRGVDWDLAFFLDPFRRYWISKLPLHPGMALAYLPYAALERFLDPLRALQVFYFLELAAGAGLYAILVQQLLRRRMAAGWACAAYLLFPLMQNLGTVYEDNLVKLPWLLGSLVLVLAHRGGHPWRLWLAAGLAGFVCFVSLDAVFWLPFLGLLILWRFHFSRPASERSGWPVARQGLLCSLAGGVAIALAAVVQDWISGAPIGRSFDLIAYGFASASRGAPPSELSWYAYFLYAPLDPLFGLSHVAQAMGLLEADTDTGIGNPALVLSRSVPALGLVTLAWLAAQVALFAWLARGWSRRTDREQRALTAIVIPTVCGFYLFNAIYNDAPNERYDHVVVLLPFVLAILPREGEAGRLRRFRPEYVFIAFAMLGLLRFAVAPRGVSFLHQMVEAHPGKHLSYYFSIVEIDKTIKEEAVFLAGYRPLRIVNTTGRELGLFAPQNHLVRLPFEEFVLNHREVPGVYVSPGLSRAISRARSETRPGAGLPQRRRRPGTPP